jgi:hypothetical protein
MKKSIYLCILALAAAVLLAGCTAAKDNAAAMIGEATPGVSASVSAAETVTNISASTAQTDEKTNDFDVPYNAVFIYEDRLLSEVDKEYLQYGVKTSVNGYYQYFFCPYGKDQILYGVFIENDNKEWVVRYYWLYSKDMVSRADFCKNIGLDTTIKELCLFDPHAELDGSFSSCTPARTFFKEGGRVNMRLDSFEQDRNGEEYDHISQMQMSPYNIYQIIREEDRPENVKSRISWENSVNGGAQ